MREALCLYRHDHKLLKINLVIRVRTTVQNVHHWNRQNICIHTTDIFIQWHSQLIGRSSCTGQRHCQNRIGTQPGFIRCAIQIDHHGINFILSAHFHTFQGFRNLTVHVLNSLHHTFSKVDIHFIVAQFRSLMDTSTST